MKKKKKKQELTANEHKWENIEVIVVAGLLLLSFILRLIYLAHLKANDPYFYQPQAGTDMLDYHTAAHAVLNGTLPNSPYYAGPFYYHFLALIYRIFGADQYIIRLIQTMLGVATFLLIYLIAKKVFNKPVALISLFISVFYSIFYIYRRASSYGNIGLFSKYIISLPPS
ncbi:MAG: glycosyltransferase family 39 protein [bacterium]|nr:glycosyltransferase family 39 protein [bacterium]